MKKPIFILAVGLFFVLLWLYATNRISGILCWILCAILFALTFAKDSAVKILSLGILIGGALGVVMMSERGETMIANTNANAAEAVEYATRQLISVSKSHGRKLKLEIIAGLVKIIGGIITVGSALWGAIHLFGH